MKNNLEKVRSSLDIANTSAVDTVSGSPFALVRVITGLILLVAWFVNNMGQTDLIMLIMSGVALARIAGVFINYVCAHRGIVSDVGYTVHNIGRATDAMVWGMLTVAGLLLFGLEVGLLVYIASVVNNIIVFRAYRAVQDSLYMNASERNCCVGLRALPEICAVVTAVIYVLLIYFVAVNGTGTPMARLLSCLSLAERLGADVFTPFLLFKYRRAFDD